MANVEPLYNPNDGLTGRDGGPYLDQVQAREAEKRRAEVENREPDFDKPGANAGIPLYTAAQMMDSALVNSHPSQADRRHVDARRLFEGAVADENSLLTATGSAIPLDEIDDANHKVEHGDEAVTSDERPAHNPDEVDPFNL